VELTGLAWRPLGWELTHAAFRSMVLLAAVMGFRHRRRIDDHWLLAALGAELAVYTLFFPTTRLLAPFSAMLMNITHDSEHYGNIVTYLRMKGIVPPSSQSSR